VADRGAGLPELSDQKAPARSATIPDAEAIAKAAVTRVVAMSSKSVFMAVFLCAGTDSSDSLRPGISIEKRGFGGE
jgi:hypothetical protein